MIYYGEFLTKINEEGALVKNLYAEKNGELFRLLSNYKKPADYEDLKQGIYTLLAQMPEYQAMKAKLNQPKATYPPKTMQDAIELLEAEGSFTQVEANQLRNLH